MAAPAVEVGDIVLVANDLPALVTEVLGNWEISAWGPNKDGETTNYARLARRSPEDYDDKGGGGTWWYKS
jgi:hypothetical protein